MTRKSSQFFPNTMREKEIDNGLMHIVKDIQRLAPGKLLAYHTFNSERSVPGFPDWVFAGMRGTAFRENKTEKGELSAPQVEWMHMLNDNGSDFGVRRPSDLASGHYAMELAYLAGFTLNQAREFTTNG